MSFIQKCPKRPQPTQTVFIQHFHTLFHLFGLAGRRGCLLIFCFYQTVLKIIHGRLARKECVKTNTYESCTYFTWIFIFCLFVITCSLVKMFVNHFGERISSEVNLHLRMKWLVRNKRPSNWMRLHEYGGIYISIQQHAYTWCAFMTVILVFIWWLIMQAYPSNVAQIPIRSICNFSHVWIWF